ncbi:MAG: hypothetical protein JNK38_27395 [Acidobacteria bacterium]|nr:hypothetical protein [Acidobacteriota bacterium]
MIHIGCKVNYPNQGPCLIDSVVKKDVAGNPMSFYCLALLDDRGGELFVPVEKAEDLGLRPLLKKSEIPRLLGQLAKDSQVVKDWKQRTKDHLKLLASGSAFDLADVVESLTTLNKSKLLSFRENSLLEKAKRLLVCEISEVLGESKAVVEARIDLALKVRKEL